jgi:hypothetical protein
VDIHRTLPPLATADNVATAVLIQIREDGVFGRRYLTGSDRRPRRPDPRRTRVQIHADFASLFPTGRQIGEPVAIDIRDANPVGAARAVVDHVQGPSRLGIRGKTVKAAKERESCAGHPDFPPLVFYECSKVFLETGISCMF